MYGTVNMHSRRNLREGTICTNEKKTPGLPGRDSDAFDISRS